MLATKVQVERPKARGVGQHGVGQHLVQVREVARQFGELVVLDGINLDIDRGDIFGLVGPSGSGKTTLVKVIVGLLRASQGYVLVDAVHSDQLGSREKGRIGYMPQDFSLYPSLTVLENARFAASIYGLGYLSRRRRIRDTLSLLEIWDARHRLAQDLSGGMRRRLALAASLLHRPDFLVVDEPTAGLDPDLRQRIWDLLYTIRHEGTTILLTTQYLEEAERCDSVAILRDGRLAATGTPDSLRQAAGMPGSIEIEAQGLSREIVEAVLRLDRVRGVEWDRTTRLQIRAEDQASTQLEVSALLESHGCKVHRIESRSATFEEVFTSIVQGKVQAEHVQTAGVRP